MCQSRVGWWLYVSSNTSAIFETQLVQALSDTEADLKKMYDVYNCSDLKR